MAKKVINFMCTAFRDGFQSVFGMRVLPKDYFPAIEMAKDAGIRYFEAGGGAAFQSAFFYCNENAFDVMDKFREVAGSDANLQTLARGINVVGLDSMSTDLIKLHAKLFKKHGMTTIRNFDALNDPNNLIVSGQAIKDAGLQHQMTITIMSLPPGCEGAHDPDFYEQRLRAVLDAEVPFDSLCLKDASGTCTPAIVHETIKRMRKSPCLRGDKSLSLNGIQTGRNTARALPVGFQFRGISGSAQLPGLGVGHIPGNGKGDGTDLAADMNIHNQGFGQFVMKLLPGIGTARLERADNLFCLFPHQMPGLNAEIAQNLPVLFQKRMSLNIIVQCSDRIQKAEEGKINVRELRHHIRTTIQVSPTCIQEVETTLMSGSTQTTLQGLKTTI